MEKGRRVFFIIIKDSSHATNFESCVIRHLQRHPEINTLVSQASQVEEKCFRSKRPNFASKNAFSPSAALRAAACKARVALGRVRQEKSQNKSPELPDIEPCDKLRALRLSSAEFQRKFCPLFLPLVGASCSYTSNSKREAKKQGVRDAYPLLFGSPCWTRTSDTLINSQVLYRLS